MPIAGQSHRFARAIARQPAASCVDGLRASDKGAPDLNLFQAQHASYVSALIDAGVEVQNLPALEAFPDSVFVEDTTLCLPEGAVLLRPGAASRAGETPAIADAVAGLAPVIARLEGDGTVDGGDIMTTEREIIIGLSERSSHSGAEALARLVADWGHKLRIAETPPGVLHFKSDCAILDEETVLATRRLAETGVFGDYRVLITPDGEEAAANAIRVNDKVFLASGHPGAADMLVAAGYDVLLLDVSEATKLDGGLSCMSLRMG